MNRQLPLVFLSFVLYATSFAQNNQDTSINLFFQTNRYTLTAQQADSILAFIRSYPAIIHITGYTDTVGTPNHNLVLSRKRAFSAYSVAKRHRESLSADIIAYTGESEELPQAAMNRRVQLRARRPIVQVVKQQQADNSGDTIRELNLENIYFVPDKSILLQESIAYLQELAERLKGIPDGTFEIVGHVNYQSRLDSSRLADLYELSRLRAKAVHDYLVQLGVPAAKMTYKGVGNSQPLFAAPKNEEEKKKEHAGAGHHYEEVKGTVIALVGVFQTDATRLRVVRDRILAF